MKITRRGWIVIVILLIAFFWWAMDATTPPECKVPVDQMSQFCVDLLYPNQKGKNENEIHDNQ